MSRFFTIYAVLDYIGFVVLLFVMKETKGLSDKQKKSLYRKRAASLISSANDSQDIDCSSDEDDMLGPRGY